VFAPTSAVLAQVRLSRDGEAVRTVTPTLTPAAAATGAIDCQAALLLDGLTPGADVLVPAVEAGRERVVRAVSFTVR
jgi:hypothetical protein